MYVCMYPQIKECNAYVCMYAGWRTFDARRGDGTLDHPFVKRPRLHAVVSNLGMYTSHLGMSSIITFTYGYTRLAYEDLCKHLLDFFVDAQKLVFLIC